MGRLELFPFRFRDPVTGRWVRARYRAERHDIARRYTEYEITGPPEIRDGDPHARRFTPHAERPRDAGSRRSGVAVPELQPHLARPPAVDLAEIALLQVFLRRYVRYCARRRRFAAMNGAARLFTELSGAMDDRVG